jgi:hypothetical protein
MMTELNLLREQQKTLMNDINNYTTLLNLKKQRLEIIEQELNILNNKHLMLNNTNNLCKEIILENKEKDFEKTNISSKYELLSLLDNYPVELKYKKLNGEIVIRNISLNIEILDNNNIEYISNTPTSKKNNDNYIFAFDLDKKIIKKFLIKNIIKVSLAESFLI